MWHTCLVMRGWRGEVEWVRRVGRGVDTDPEVRVRFPSIVMEIVWLWGHTGIVGRAIGRSGRLGGMSAG
jgi:hypothetical protein